MRKATTISERRACRLVGLARTVLHYESKTNPAAAQLEQRLIELAHERRRFGYRRLHVLMRREGVAVNHKRVWRLYRKAGLAVRRRRRRRGVAIDREPLVIPSAPNQVWSMDFVMDALANGRRVKCLTIVDDFTKEAVDIVADHNIPACTSRGCSTKPHNFAACRRQFAPTKDRSSPAALWINGPIATACNSSSLPRASRRRTPLWKASTDVFATSA